VRREQQVGRTGERRSGGQRLGVEHVERRAAELPARERRRDGRLVDDAAARGVDQDRAALHRREPSRVDEVPRRRDQRHVQRDDVGLREQRLETARLDARVAPRRRVRRQRDVVADRAHAERAAHPRGTPADVAEADDAQRPAGDLAARRQRGARPAARGDVAGRPVGAAQ
jgi:hypothetical protein